MTTNLFEPTFEGEARLLLLIDAFSGESPTSSLEGRTKLAKLDFFLRYPRYFKRALEIRGPKVVWPEDVNTEPTIESRMIRYRFGPWDAAYFSLLGRLMGRDLVRPVPNPRGIGFRTTDRGKGLAIQLAETEDWRSTRELTRLLRRHFNLTGTNLKKFIYQNFPEVTQARWGDRL